MFILSCLQSLSRVTRVDPSVFLAVIDACGPAAVLESLAGAGSRVQQHLLTALATALVTSQIQTHRITQSRVCMLLFSRIQKSFECAVVLLPSPTKEETCLLV